MILANENGIMVEMKIEERWASGSKMMRSKTGGVIQVVRYVVTKGKADGREQYGIAVMGEQEQVDSIDDVASSLEETMMLAAFLQENGVAAVHFRDVVEDYLAR